MIQSIILLIRRLKKRLPVIRNRDQDIYGSRYVASIDLNSLEQPNVCVCHLRIAVKYNDGIT